MTNYRVSTNNNNSMESSPFYIDVPGCAPFNARLRRSAVSFRNPTIHETRGNMITYVLVIFSYEIWVIILKYMGSRPPAKHFESGVVRWSMMKVRRPTLKQSDQNLCKWIKRTELEHNEPLPLSVSHFPNRNTNRPYWPRWARFGNLWQSSGLKHNSTI
jgi:hypothetical protein